MCPHAFSDGAGSSGDTAGAGAGTVAQPRSDVGIDKAESFP